MSAATDCTAWIQQLLNEARTANTSDQNQVSRLHLKIAAPAVEQEPAAEAEALAGQVNQTAVYSGLPHMSVSHYARKEAEERGGVTLLGRGGGGVAPGGVEWEDATLRANELQSQLSHATDEIRRLQAQLDALQQVIKHVSK